MSEFAACVAHLHDIPCAANTLIWDDRTMMQGDGAETRGPDRHPRGHRPPRSDGPGLQDGRDRRFARLVVAALRAGLLPILDQGRG